MGGGGGAISRQDHLILQAAMGARELTAEELDSVIQHAAQAGFDPTPNARARGLSGITWQGRALKGRDRITAAERHYLEHVIQIQEWPHGTTLQDYLPG